MVPTKKIHCTIQQKQKNTVPACISPKKQQFLHEKILVVTLS